MVLVPSAIPNIYNSQLYIMHGHNNKQTHFMALYPV